MLLNSLRMKETLTRAMIWMNPGDIKCPKDKFCLILLT